MKSPAGRCVVLGGGSHARVLIEILRQTGPSPYGILDAALTVPAVLGIPVLGDDSLLPQLLAAGVDRFVVGVGSNPDTAARERLYARALGFGLRPVAVRHETAVVSAAATIGPGAQLLARSVVNPGAVLAENVLINTAAVVEHDCRIGPHAHVAPGAVLCGGVTVGAGAHIGAGAVVRPGVTIGERAVVGLGAAVVRPVPAGATVVGVPARGIASRRENRLACPDEMA